MRIAPFLLASLALSGLVAGCGGDPSPSPAADAAGPVDAAGRMDAATGHDAATPIDAGVDGHVDAATGCVSPALDCPTPATACLHAICDASGACATTYAAPATPCSDGGGRVCDAAGHCVECNASTDCNPPMTICSAGACVPNQSNGASCSAASDCASGNCVDGVCCDTACAGTCEACTSARRGAGADGACGPIAAGSDPDAECADAGAPSCGTDGFCDGAGACERYPLGTTCGPATCTGSTYTAARTCDGLGTCVAGAMQPCDPYVCGTSSTCLVACASDADCLATDYCTAGGMCAPRLGSGSLCSRNAECTSSFCVDGFCCNSACTGTCMSCGGSLPGTCSLIPVGGTDTNPTCSGANACDGAGSCKFASGFPCTSNAQCASGFCRVNNTCQ